MRAAGGRQRSVQAAKGAASGDQVGHGLDREAGRRVTGGAAPDQHHPFGNPVQHRELPLEYREAADEQRAFVAAGEPARLASGKDCRIHGRFYLNSK